jgi:uncharacterized protein YbaR (Trm112 family)
VRKDLEEIVCCPVHTDKRLLLTVRERDEHGDAKTGTLRCTACRFDYPIEEGIPNLLPPEYHLDEVREKAPAAASPAKAKAVRKAARKA